MTENMIYYCFFFFFLSQLEDGRKRKDVVTPLYLKKLQSWYQLYCIDNIETEIKKKKTIFTGISLKIICLSTPT